MFEVANTTLEQPDQEGMRRLGFDFQTPPIQAQKNICREKRRGCVAIYKRMVHQQRFEQCCGHLDDVTIVTCLRPIQRALEQAQIPDPTRAAKTLDESLVDDADFVE